MILMLKKLNLRQKTVKQAKKKPRTDEKFKSTEISGVFTYQNVQGKIYKE